ncbi:MAG: chloride channel protein [Verrucomicrobiales bacterium]|nr:chloride channel protein [Verrucomicrobiales bacterium]
MPDRGEEYEETVEENASSGEFVERTRWYRHIHRHLNFSVFGLSLLAIPVGIISAYGAWGFREAFGLMGKWFRSDVVANAGVLHLVELTVGGLVFGVTLSLLKWNRFRTPAHVIVAASENEGKLSIRDGLVTIVADALSLALAAPVGRYGPAVYLGATIGSVLGQMFRMNPTSVRILLGCGVAAGISAAFNAPIAGVIFAHEVILGHFRLRAFAPITLASVAAVALTRFHHVEYVGLKLWTAPHPVTLWDYPFFLLLGLIVSLFSMVYMTGIMRASGLADRLRIPLWCQPMLGGAIAGTIALWSPLILGMGDNTLVAVLEQDLDRPRFDMLALAGLCVAKLLASVCCLGLRFPGGAFMPAMFVGASVGGMYAMLVPSIDYQIGVLVGMGALVSAVIGAPLAVILIVFELTENYQAATAVMVAVVASNAVVTRFFARSLFHRQIRYWGIEINRPAEQRIMAKRRVSELARRKVISVPGEIKVEEAIQSLGPNLGKEIFVVDARGELIGQLPREGWTDWEKDAEVGDLVEKPEVVLSLEESLWSGFEKLDQSGISTAPVVESEESYLLAGVAAFPDFLAAYRQAVEQGRGEGQ